jgi:hypothetical protein
MSKRETSDGVAVWFWKDGDITVDESSWKRYGVSDAAAMLAADQVHHYDRAELPALVSAAERACHVASKASTEGGGKSLYEARLARMQDILDGKA